MHVVALLSGGKDSVYNLMHCVANGHEVVAIATLTPEAGIDELDSYMYQSVGTDLVDLIAQSLRLPLVKRVIEGRPVETALQYGAGSRGGREEGVRGDETEDLFELLSEVKRQHPSVQAVASGAILSNYQRTRVEHVASRLGLASLAFLWQRPEGGLVDEMVGRGGMDAVLIKVAGMGLKETDVGRTLREMRPKLESLEQLYNSHVAGEGGEFETTTVDCPLFHERIVFDETETIVTDPSPVAYLRIKRAHLEPKPDHRIPSPAELREMLGIDEPGAQGMALFDEMSEEVLEDVRAEGLGEVEEREKTLGGQDPATLDVDGLNLNAGEAKVVVQFSQVERSFAVSIHVLRGASLAFEDEVERVFQQLKETLQSHDLTTSDIQHQNFLLADMSTFAAANAIYSRYFGTSPPSRACVAVAMPADRRVVLEAVGVQPMPGGGGQGARSALHVQSMSYWAPANIGPYSQAVTADHRVTIAGQIGLVPPTLALSPAHSFAEEAVLSLQHARRIIDLLESPESTGGCYTGWPEGMICWTSSPDLIRPAKRIWQRHTRAWARPDCPALFVAVKGLPRSARVEWQLSMHTGRSLSTGSAANDGDDDAGPAVERSTDLGPESDLTEYTTFGPRLASWTLVGTSGDAGVPLGGWRNAVLATAITSAFSIRVFALASVSGSDIDEVISKHGRSRIDACVTRVTCSHIADREGRSIRLAFVLVGK